MGEGGGKLYPLPWLQVQIFTIFIQGEITLTGHKERYVVTFPSAFARSILTTPWMELGGRCTITCDQTNMAASVVFHTKPVYGGHPHRFVADTVAISI